MALMDHLRELRSRVIYSVLALFAGMGVSMLFTKNAIEALTGLCQVCIIIVVDPTESFISYFRVALILGLVVAMPVILYQAVAFLVPALHQHERRWLYILLPTATVLFALGLAFGYFLVLPRTIDFLSRFFSDLTRPGTKEMLIQTHWTLANYIAFVTNMLLICGLAFETPMVVYSLAKIGILSPSLMSRYRRHAILGFAILAAVLTPTPDPFTMLMVMLPMYLLYESGLIMARFF